MPLGIAEENWMADENQAQSLIFGSYNRQELEIVQTIKLKLQSRGLDLWLDTQRLLAGREWMAELEAVILRSRAAVIFKGPHGFGNFQREEVSVLFRLHADQKLVVIPALLPGASGKDAGLFLGSIHHVDFRLKNPNPLDELVAGLAQNMPAHKTSAQPPGLVPSAAHSLVQWIVNEMINLQEIDSYGRRYIEAKRWPEALYIYHRLASLAISRSNRVYAESYMQIGRIYFLAGERDKAEKKWEISLRIYQDYFQAELPRLRDQLNAIRARAAANSPAG